MRRAIRRFAAGGDATLLAIVVLGYLALVIDSHGGLASVEGTRNLLQYLAVPMLIGLAQASVLMVGQLNLAIGAMGGFTAAVMGVLMNDHQVPTAWVILAGVAVSSLLGLVNGVLVVLTRFDGFIVTLATMTALTGGTYALLGTRVLDHYSPGMRALGSAALGPVPVIFLIAVATAVLLAVFLRHAIAGRALLASGGNPVAARLSGISNDRSVIAAHTLSGLLVGIAAVLMVASVPGVNTSLGNDWLLKSFAAPIIGGVALTGGSLAVLGTALAALIIRLVEIAQAQFSLDPNWVNFVVGTVVLGTVLVGRWRQRGQR
ncbi:MAG TPA: ABC transporter permease [Pseudonocardiaceae bacterium]